MNIRDLKYLIAVADYRHFGKAAKACFVSQPTLSAQLKKLEEELGVQLFERNNKQVFITPIGQTIIAQARIALRETEKLRELSQLAKDPFAGKFKLGVIPTLGPYLLPHILPIIKHKLPQLELLLFEDKTENVLAQLQQGKLDAIILALPVPHDGMVVRELFKEPFYVALPKQHVLDKQKNIKLKDLHHETLLLLEEGHCMRDQALAVCRSAKPNERNDYYATSLETLRQMVGIGAGVTLLPLLALMHHHLVVNKAFSDPVPTRKVGMLWRKQSARTECCEKIVELVKEKMPEVLGKLERQL